jgi:hypothetical protein
VIAFWFFVAIAGAFSVGVVAGAAFRLVTDDDKAAADGETLPARHRRTPVRPWTPAERASRWVVPAVDEQEPKP